MDGNHLSSYNSGSLSEAGQEVNAGGRIDIEQLRDLVRLLDRSEVSELEVKQADGRTRLVLRKAKAPAESVQQIASPVPQLVQEEQPAGPKETKHTVVAPLVGVFHTWARPEGKALVSTGDQVKVGQLVGTIQSLNVINEVESGIAGRISEILVHDGQPVEYGQPLMTIESVEEA
jgi:acetyl-CoA carboxylase biotin carboxyl carrier protein